MEPIRYNELQGPTPDTIYLAPWHSKGLKQLEAESQEVTNRTSYIINWVVNRLKNCGYARARTLWYEIQCRYGMYTKESFESWFATFCNTWQYIKQTLGESPMF